jgi:hypothetical protein
MFSRRVLPVFALAFVSAACTGGTETGNPSFSGALSYTGYSSSPDIAVGESGAEPRLSVENAWLSLDGVTLSREGACALEATDAVRLPALGVGDHAAGAHNFTPFEAAAGAYCNVELPLKRVTSAEELGSAPAELEQHSILLTARLADGTPLRILSAATPRVVLLPDRAGFELLESGGDLLIAFDFAAWLGELDFTAATRVEGAIEVSEQANPELLAAFEAQLSRGVALYRDRDGDGRLDAELELLARGE